MRQKNYEYSFKNLLLYFLKLGAVGFGGPIALIGYMERDLVEERAWLTKEQYLRGLTLSQIAPGPLAAQLAIYVGYAKGKILGATLVGIAFVLPSFLMVLLLGILYVAYGNLVWIQALFYGIGAAVIGIIVKSTHKLIKITLKRKTFLWIIFTVMCAVTIYTQEENVFLFILSGIVALFVYAPPKLSFQKVQSTILPFGFFLYQNNSLTETNKLVNIFLFFSKAGAFVFGSGLAIVPFLHGGLVQQYHWLNEKQFLDAVAVAMITPGPVVITVGFIGYLVAGFPGAVLAAAGVFFPVYLFVIVPAKYFEKYGENLKVRAFVDGVTSAAIGAIAGAVFILGQRAISNIPTALICIVTLIVLYRYKIPEPIIIVVAGVLGLILFQSH